MRTFCEIRRSCSRKGKIAAGTIYEIGSNNFKDLRVYKLAYELGLEIHTVTMTFPRFELYELGSQMRRCSKSVPANIAEGYGRSHYGAEFIRFLVLALASTDEMKVHLQYASDLNYIVSEQYSNLNDRYEQAGKMLHRLINVLDQAQLEPAT